MRIYLQGSGTALNLAKNVKNRYKGRIKLNHAMHMVAHAFGYDHYQQLKSMDGLVDPSSTDLEASPEERSARFAQYIQAITEYGFTTEEAEEMISTVGIGGFWGAAVSENETLKRTTIAERALRPSPNKMQFVSPLDLERFRVNLQGGVETLGIELPIRTRHLMAKLFGYESFPEMYDCAGHGVPSAPDSHVSPEALDARVQEYLAVLLAAGFSEDQGRELLQIVSYGGWWGLEEGEWTREGVRARQEGYVDRIEGSRSWRRLRALRPGDFGYRRR
ncbi:hypothetical protein EFQ99_16400 [Rhizobium vallis]|uniref:Uncharacterized protein n=1 Tax=Rhizobium vallis TaxID=634290 RepID=A0A432PKB4_9HYPH|nr:hypothetical protein [Rhizobium vallis]RUM24367.1 hypothetical protein EFQ99_16400 [Rhizobium vallis]